MEAKISKKKFDILVLPGDGVGPEVINEAIKIVDVVNELTEIKIKIKLKIKYEFDYIGGTCIDRYDQSIREETLKESVEKRPEQALLIPIIKRITSICKEL